MELGALTHPLWRLASWVPGLLLKRVFSHARMAKLVEVSVRAEGDRIEFNCGEVPDVTIWLTVRNRAPFSVDLDRARVELACGGRRLGDMWFLDRIRVRPGGVADLMVRGLHGARFDELLRSRLGDLRCSLQIRAHFESKVGRFVLDTRRLEGVKPDVVNLRSPSTA